LAIVLALAGDSTMTSFSPETPPDFGVFFVAVRRAPFFLPAAVTAGAFFVTAVFAEGVFFFVVFFVTVVVGI
jgi:hypothetical protein